MKRTTRFVVFFAVAALAAFVLIRTMGAQQDAMPFDQTVWTDDDAIYQEPNPRRLMADDVMKNHLRTGMSRQDVIALLGKPTDAPHFQDRDLVYWLGSEGGFISIDSSWLVLDLGETGTVEKFELVTD